MPALLRYCLLLPMLLLSLGAPAAVVTITACTEEVGQCVTRIDDLIVGGAIYDVSFVRAGSYDGIYAAAPPTFLGDEAGATAVAQAIVNLLRPFAIDGIGEGSPYENELFWYMIPYKLHGAADPWPGAVDFVGSIYYDYGWQSGWRTDIYNCDFGQGCFPSSYDWYADRTFYWTTFTVPEPDGAMLLLVAGGAAAWTTVRMRRSKMQPTVTPRP